MANLNSITTAIKNNLRNSKSLNDNDFDKLLANIQYLIKNATQLRRKKQATLLETPSFREFVKADTDTLN